MTDPKDPPEDEQPEPTDDPIQEPNEADGEPAAGTEPEQED